MKILPFQTEADVHAVADEVEQHLAAGRLLAYPTETVYGLGSLLDPAATARLAELKGRALDRPFLVLDAAPRQLPGLHWTRVAEALAAAFWPGPLSLALAADHTWVPPVRSPEGTVAVRDTPLVTLRALLSRLGRSLTSTSANLPGQPPATTLAELLDTLAHFPQHTELLVLDGGALPASAPSTVIDCSGTRARVVRAGEIPITELRAVLQQPGFTIDG
jgi:L-threonylcarbamoyladenylate synthase